MEFEESYINRFKKYLKSHNFNWNLKLFIFVPLIFGIILLDNATKIYAYNHLHSNQVIVFIPHLINFCLVINPGSAFGANSNNIPLTISLALVVTLLCTIAFLFFSEPLYLFSFMLILGGSLGNLVNRIWLSKGVVDFLSWELWKPNFIFNLADFFVTFGIIFLGISILLVEFLFNYMRKKAENDKTNSNKKR